MDPSAPNPVSLSGLLATLRRRAAAGETQTALVRWLRQHADRAGVRMCCESLKKEDHPEAAGDATRRWRHRFRQVPVTIRRGLLRVELNETRVGRIILSCERRGCAATPLWAECNGAVIDACTWRRLAVPPRAFGPRPSAKAVNRLLAIPDADGVVRTGPYDVIRVNDGTVVTLYRWTHPAKGPVWCLATSNGYDVSSLKWMGEKTYAEAIHELLLKRPGFSEAVGLELRRDKNDTRLDFKKLDAGWCYTFGFRHPHFHPMDADQPGVWNIQATKLFTGAAQPSGLCGGLPAIPPQETFSRADVLSLLAACGGGARPPEAPLRVADLEFVSRTALEDAKAAVASGSSSAAARGFSFNYGFILRSRDVAKTGRYSDVLYESPLLLRVRQLLYQRPPRHVRDKLDASTRLEFCALRAYLVVTSRNDFSALFPRFARRFETYGRFLDDVVAHIVQWVEAAATGRCGWPAPAPSTADAQTKTIAQALATHILKHEGGAWLLRQGAHNVVRDFVVQPEYALIYLRALRWR